MYTTIDGPEPDDLELWEEYVEEAYGEYKEKGCACNDKEDCECLSFGEFRKKMLDDLEGDWGEDHEDWEDYAC